MINNQELAIITNVLKGDTAQFALLVNTYQQLAITLAYNILLNRHDAEDVAQESFIKAYTSLKTFKGDARFATWFYRIVINTSLTKKKQKKFKHEALDEINGEATDNNAEMNNFLQQNQMIYVKHAMEKLTEAERICITMFYLNELSVEEIGQLTDYSVSNIKVLLHRGRKHLYYQLNLLLNKEITDIIK